MKYNKNISTEIIALGEELEKAIKYLRLKEILKDYANLGYKYLTIDFFNYVTIHKLKPFCDRYGDWGGTRSKCRRKRLFQISKGTDLFKIVSSVSFDDRLFQF